MPKHWTDPIAAILTSQTGNLRELANIAGFDPRTFYVRQDLSGCDLRGQDLRNMDFTDCNLEFSILDNGTLIDPEFDPRIEDRGDYWKFNISSEMNTMVLNYMRDASYIYSAWAYKNLVESAFSAIYEQESHFFDNIIESNSNLSRVLKDKRKINQVKIRVLLYYNSIRKMETFLNRPLTAEDGRRMIMIGLLRYRIKYQDKRDYSTLSLNAFYPPKMIKVERSLSGTSRNLDP